jgi:hypothetical protein
MATAEAGRSADLQIERTGGYEGAAAAPGYALTAPSA